MQPKLHSQNTKQPKDRPLRDVIVVTTGPAICKSLPCNSSATPALWTTHKQLCWMGLYTIKFPCLDHYKERLQKLK